MPAAKPLAEYNRGHRRQEPNRDEIPCRICGKPNVGRSYCPSSHSSEQRKTALKNAAGVP